MYGILTSLLIIAGVCDYIWCKAMIAFPKYALWCYNYSGIKLLGGSFELYMKMCEIFASISIPIGILSAILFIIVINAKES